MFIQGFVSVKLGKPVVSFVAIGNMESDPLVPPMFFGFTPARTPLQKILHAGAGLVSEQFLTKPARVSYVRQLQGYGLRTDRGVPITDEPYRWSDAVSQTSTASLDFPRQHNNPRVRYGGGPAAPWRQGRRHNNGEPRGSGGPRGRRPRPYRSRHPGDSGQQGSGETDDPHD